LTETIVATSDAAATAARIKIFFIGPSVFSFSRSPEVQERFHCGTSRQPNGIREAQNTSRALSSRCARLLTIIEHAMRLAAVMNMEPTTIPPCPAPKCEPPVPGIDGGGTTGPSGHAEVVAAVVNDSIKKIAIIFLITPPGSIQSDTFLATRSNPPRYLNTMPIGWVCEV
jgi:hypothetical protein